MTAVTLQRTIPALATKHSIGSLAGDRSDWRHLVFFRHIITGPDNFNNVLALAFGVLIVGLIIIGSLWIMTNMNHNMMPMHMMMG